MKKLRVLEINKYYSPVIGGIESHVKDIADNLSGDFDITVLVCNTKNKTEVIHECTDCTNTTNNFSISQEAKSRSFEEKKKEEIRIYKVASLGKLFSMPISFSFFYWFKKLSKNKDIIHFHHPFPLGEICYLFFLPFLYLLHLRSVGLPSLRRWNKKVPKIIVTWHSDILRQKFFLFFYRSLLKLFLKRCDKIIVTSPNMINCSEFLQPFRDKIEVIPLGIDTKRFENPDKKKIEEIRGECTNYTSFSDHLRGGSPTLPKCGKGNNKPFLLSVGRLAYYKGFEYLIEAMKNVDANLLIIGTGGLENNLKLTIKNSMPAGRQVKLVDKVKIIPPVSDHDLVNFYHACDIFVLPSIAKTEAFGIVQLEAMAAGKPVINTNLPTGVPWVSINAQTGLTVLPGNSQALARAINKLLADKKLRIKFGQNAQQRVQENFTLNNMVNKIYKLYVRIMSNKRRKNE